MLGPLAAILSPVQSTVRKKLQLIMTIIAGKLQDGKYPYCCYTASQWLSILRKTAKRLQLFLWNRDHPSQPCQMLTMLCTFLMKTSNSSSIVRYCALLFFVSKVHRVKPQVLQFLLDLVKVHSADASTNGSDCASTLLTIRSDWRHTDLTHHF